MILKNSDIYDYSIKMAEAFQNCEIAFPVRINFFLQKNMRVLTAAAQEIEQARMTIAQKYGTFNQAEGSFIVPDEHRMEAQQELYDLFNLSQEIPLQKLPLSGLENINLTYKQMDAMMFMVEEDL